MSDEVFADEMFAEKVLLIRCMGIPDDPYCDEFAAQVVILHGQCAGIFCVHHYLRRVQEVMNMGHGSCRTYLLEASGYKLEHFVAFANKYRGKLAVLPPGRFFKPKRKRK